jgi:signal transduction histidine kinase
VTPKQLQGIDLALAFLLVITSGHEIFTIGSANRNPANFVLVLVAGVAVAFRRRVPMIALTLMTLAVAVATALGERWAGDPLVAIPMYQVASIYSRRRSFPAFIVAGSALVIGAATGALLHRPGAGTFGVVVSIAIWFVGDSIRVRRVYGAGLAEQTLQRQREIVERAQRSVAEERLQIARELHDVVAHSLSVIAVQSGVGRHVIDDQPEEAKKALAAVEATSKSALDELRRMLGVLRRDDSMGASRAPAPDVSALGDLIDQVRATGLVVNLDVHSELVRTLSPSIGLSIYRIAQEALTNVVKHAGPATVNVEIRDELDALVLEVNDNGRGITRSVAGLIPLDIQGTHHGILGMRERVALFNGSFSAGPRPEGGFCVLARFPSEGYAPL